MDEKTKTRGECARAPAGSKVGGARHPPHQRRLGERFPGAPVLPQRAFWGPNCRRKTSPNFAAGASGCTPSLTILDVSWTGPGRPVTTTTRLANPRPRQWSALGAHA